MTSSSLLRTARIAITLSLALSCIALATVSDAAEWDPNAFRTERTLEFLTIGPDEGEHWSTVWLVVIDGQLYVRLGTTAVNRPCSVGVAELSVK